MRGRDGQVRGTLLRIAVIGMLAATIGCQSTGRARPSMRPMVRLEQARVAGESRPVLRGQLPLEWHPAAPVTVRYLLAADVGQQSASALAVQQTLRFSRDASTPAQRWTLTGSLRAGRQAAIDLATDSTIAFETPGMTGTLDAVTRGSATLTSTYRIPLRGTTSVQLRGDGNVAGPLGAATAAVTKQSRLAVGAVLVSRVSRIETRETQLSLVEERRANAPPLLSTTATAGLTRDWTRALSGRFVGGVQLSRLAAGIDEPSTVHLNPIGEGTARWRLSRGPTLSLAAGSQMRLDPQRALARRQWNIDLRADWRVSSAWRVTTRWQHAQLLGGATASQTRTFEVTATSRLASQGTVDIGVRTLSLQRPVGLARSMPLEGTHDLRLFIAWSPGVR